MFDFFFVILVILFVLHFSAPPVQVSATEIGHFFFGGGVLPTICFRYIISTEKMKYVHNKYTRHHAPHEHANTRKHQTKHAHRHTHTSLQIHTSIHPCVTCDPSAHPRSMVRNSISSSPGKIDSSSALALGSAITSVSYTHLTLPTKA